jgi:predicted negative regulator of RcsB-dependent stress response
VPRRHQHLNRNIASLNNRQPVEYEDRQVPRVFKLRTSPELSVPHGFTLSVPPFWFSPIEPGLPNALGRPHRWFASRSHLNSILFVCPIRRYALFCDSILASPLAFGVQALAHISRKELKKDEVRETLAHGAQAVLSHQQFTVYLLIAAVLAALGAFGWRTYVQRQTVKASAAFDDAMKIFQARVLASGETPQPGELTYKDERMKFSESAKKFADVAAKFPRTQPGRLAGYFEALSLEKLDKNDDAKKLLRGLAGGGDEELAAMARFALAQLDDRTGEADEAVKLYRQLIAKPTVLVPKPVVMLALAEHYHQKDPSEAAKLYGQIKSDYPDTPIAQQADQELALLPGKS